jgi:hypothetical protein
MTHLQQDLRASPLPPRPSEKPAAQGRLIQDLDSWTDIEAVLALGVNLRATLDATGCGVDDLLPS